MDPNQPDYSSIDSTTKRVLLKQQRALKKLKNRVNLNVVVKNTEMYQALRKANAIFASNDKDNQPI